MVGVGVVVLVMMVVVVVMVDVAMVVIEGAIVIMTMALLGSGVVNYNGADVSGDQLIVTNPGCSFVISIVFFREILILYFLDLKGHFLECPV